MITNSKLKYLTSLKQKKYRRTERKFLAEGENLLQSAIKNNLEITEIFYSVDYGEDRLKKLSGDKIYLATSLNSLQMKKISDVNNPPGVIGLMPFQEYEIGDFPKMKKLLYFDSLSDPGNTGTLIRSACAFGFEGILLSPNSCEIYNPKLLRSTAGYIFNIGIAENISPNKLAEIKNYGFRLISASPQADTTIIGQKCPQKAILALGNEPHGISEEITKLVDYSLKIPMTGKVESLNVASAGAVMMYWAQS